jgi:hypothetical protein
MSLATLPQAEQIACFLHIMLTLLHRLLQFLLVIRQQSMNLAVRFVADRVNKRPCGRSPKLPLCGK